MKTTNYYMAQFDGLKPVAPYSPQILICDGQGNRTDYLNISLDQLEKIRQIFCPVAANHNQSQKPKAKSQKPKAKRQRKERMLAKITRNIGNVIREETGDLKAIGPTTVKKEYHGNGKNAWWWTNYLLESGDILEAKSCRYSYRWHKTHYYFNGQRVCSSKQYKDINKLLSK